MMPLLTALLLSGATARAQGPWYEGFEGPQTSWRLVGGDARFQVLEHRRVRNEAFTGEGCERLAVSGSGGTHVYFTHDVGHPRIIDELLPTVRIKSNRGGLELAARIVLPRTRDPQTGQPVSTLVHGSSYTMVGRWQQLRIDNVPQQLMRQTWTLRAKMGSPVDPREAYVDGILLNVYGGSGVTNVWIDDLDVSGYVETGPGSADRQTGTPGPGPSISGVAPRLAGRAGGGFTPAGGSVRQPVELDGSILLVDGRPMFPRIIQYQGESLSLLKRLGFNAVWLAEPPTGAILEEARQLDLWLVCPPPLPSPPAGSRPDAPAVAAPQIGPEYDRVLVWDLGRGLSRDELPATKRRAEQVQAADRAAKRPLICQPESDLRKYNHYVNLVMVGRSPLGTSLELADYGTWIQQRPRLARLGTPIWTTVQTQPAPGIRRQWSGLSQGTAPPNSVPAEQIRLLVHTTMAAGTRGLLFESYSPLDAPDADTRNRALALELVNLELLLIEPWLAAGSLVTTVDGSEPEVKGVVFETDRARLLVPVWTCAAAQYVPGQLAGNGISFVVRGVPESNNAYLVAPGAFEPLRPKRVTGGTRVQLDELGLTPLVLFTQDSLVINHVAQKAAQIGRRAAQLQRELAAAKLQAAEHACRQLSTRAAAHPQAGAWLAAARGSIQRADGALASRDYAEAYRHAERAMRPLRMLERAVWEATVSRLPSPASSPAAVAFATLPWHWRWMDQISSTRPGPNRLHGGQFEDLGTMLQAGWQHFQHPGPLIEARAELARVAARSGRYGLRLIAQPANADSPQILVETPPVRIRTPAVPVQTGEWLRICGWVRMPEPITGSVDGLLIVDSLSGEPLAERIRQTSGWRQFTLYRTATQQGQVSVTFALSGLGEAWVDDVTIEPVPLPSAGSAGPDIAGVRPARPPGL